MRKISSASLVLASLLLAGCGGGGGSSSPSSQSARGTATVSIVWPTSEARFVPLSANSVFISLSLGGRTVASKTVARPATGTSFDGLVYGTYDVAIAALPTTDGTGTPQALGNAQMTVTEDVPGAVDVSLATTVSTIEILPITIDKRQNAIVRVTAKDAANAIVLLSTDAGTEQIAWSVDSATIASVTGTGPTATLQGLHSGTTTVRASLSLGTTLDSSAAVTINAIADGTGTVTVH